MQKEKVEMFLVCRNDRFSDDSRLSLERVLARTSDSKFFKLVYAKLLSPWIVWFLSLSFGGLGVGRFMVGEKGLGLFRLFFTVATIIVAFFNIWVWLVLEAINPIMTIIELCTVKEKARLKNYEKILDVLRE